MKTKHVGRRYKIMASHISAKSLSDGVEAFGRAIRAVVAGIIGLALTGLFVATMVAVIVVSLFGDRSQATQLLQTALTIVSSALATVMGYFLGRARSG